MNTVEFKEKNITVKRGDYIKLETKSYIHKGLWSSSNPSVVTVTDLGRIKAVNNGSAIITVTDGEGHSDSCTVTVGDKPKEEKERNGIPIGMVFGKVMHPKK